jgi:THAP domain
MSHCGVVFCSANSATREKIIPLESPVVVDNEGSVLDGLDTKFFTLPSLPSPQTSTAEEQREAKERQNVWIHRLGRGDELPKKGKNIFICSRHFGREAYDQFVPLRQGLSSILEVSRKHPKVKLLLPSAVPTLNLPTWKLPDETDRSKRKIKKVQRESLEEALSSR